MKKKTLTSQKYENRKLTTWKNEDKELANKKCSMISIKFDGIDWFLMVIDVDTIFSIKQKLVIQSSAIK